MKTGKSHKNSGIRSLLCLLLIAISLIFPMSSSAKTPELTATPLEHEIMKTLGKNIHCKNIEVQIRFSKDKPSEVKSLAIKLESAVLGNMVADYMTIVYEKPVIDLNQLKKAKKFKILSSSNTKVSILISAKAIEGYIARIAKQVQKKPVRLSIRFSPPYAECFFDIPVSAISPEILKLLDKYVKGNKLEGYAAFQLKANNNGLSALSSKAIVNHFLIPNTIRQELQNRFNPFDRIPVLSPFQYSINHVTVQKNYLFLTN